THHSPQRREDKSQMICLILRLKKTSMKLTSKRLRKKDKVFNPRSGEILIYERTAESEQKDDSKCGRLHNRAYRGGCC
ncbi:unnamed protein product, partial [Heterotrigona itama]